MSKKTCLVAALLTVTLLLLAFLLTRSPRQKAAPAATTATAATAATTATAATAATATSAAIAAEDPAPPVMTTPTARLLPTPPAGTPEEQAVLADLQDLMDDADRHQEAKAKAMSMAASGSDLQQLAAVNALRWIGGLDAKKTLVKLMADAGEEVSDEALRVLSHLLAQDLVAEHPDPFDPTVWKEAILNVGNNAERESLLVLLGAHPARDSVPVLLDLQESKDSDLAQLATEYLEANTGGTEIQNRQQGEEWLAKHLQEQEILQKEEEKEQARDDDAQDLKRFAELKNAPSETDANKEN